jgi:hypothetical protein
MDIKSSSNNKRYMKETALDVFRIIKSSIQSLKHSLMKINVEDIIPVNVPANLVRDSGNHVSNDKQCALEASEQLSPSLVLTTWDIGELNQTNDFRQHLKSYKDTVLEIEIDPGPTPAIQEVYSIWVSYIQDMILKHSLMATIFLMSLFNIKLPEARINPDPLTHEQYSIPMLYHAYESLVYFTTILHIFRPWIAYIKDIKLMSLLIKTTIMLSPFSAKVPEEEIDPGPYQQKVKNITSIIILETIVVFRTWIGYIHKLLSSFSVQLNFESYITKIFTPSTIPQHHSRNVFNYTEETYLYHDHYMIPAIQFQASSNRSFNYHRFGYTTTWKGVRFKTIPSKITMSTKPGRGINAVATSSFIPILF